METVNWNRPRNQETKETANKDFKRATMNILKNFKKINIMWKKSELFKKPNGTSKTKKYNIWNEKFIACV